jgi:c-di-AMP phosphodiesterase-like protein
MYQLLKKRKNSFFIAIIFEIIMIFAAFYVVLRYPQILPYYIGNEKIYFIAFSLLIVIFNLSNILRTFNLLEKKGRKNYIDTKTLLSADIQETYLFGQIGLLNYDENGEIIWMSDLFGSRNINAVGLNVQEWLPTLKVFFKKELNVDQVKVELNNRIYSILNISGLNLLIFNDVTDLETLYKTYHEQALVLATIVIDNLDDLSPSSEETELNELENNVRKAIGDWARQYGIVLRKTKEDTYIGIFQEGTLRKLIASNFKIIDDIRKFKTSNNEQLTLSIGIGRGTTDVTKLAELSSIALDVTLSRGGDQVVINNYGGRLEFFGGRTQSKEKSNNVKMRILSKSLSTHISSSKQVFVMGHVQSDFDSIGACLGVLAICQRLHVPCSIVWDDKLIDPKARSAFRELFSKQFFNEMTITPARAIEKINDESLLIVVDVHRPSMTLSPQLVAVARRIALIDHHRRSEEFIDDLLLSILEPSASSTSELLAELIRYSPQGVQLNNDYATYMLTGILLDTNRYRLRTTTRTYEASMILKEFGANVEMADEYLKDGYEEYLVKTKIMNNITTPAYGIIMATSPDDEVIDRAILAKIAQDALQIKGIRASFVIGKINDDVVGLSARSNGTVNVQLLVEKLGGGGHFNSAAAQIKNRTIKEVYDEFSNVLKLYLNEVSDN